jgi:predicted FMN-binding regulatory protein PaiB
MKSINIIYNELKDLDLSIELMKEQCSEINKEFHTILDEVRETTFNASQGAKLYQSIQDFLQERRLLKARIEELEIQFELLGGKEKLNQLKSYQDFKNVPKKDKKYHRKIDYFSDFRVDIKEEIENMYHIN